MINSTLSMIANINLQNSIITPSTTMIIEISIVNAIIPFIIMNTGINRCRTVVATITITVVAFLPLLRLIRLLSSLPILGCCYYCYEQFFNISVTTSPIITTLTTSMFSNICVNSSTVVMVGINI